jgi:CelD/BcsL family acetyltransferase involved in cellulose biosynthesis
VRLLTEGPDEFSRWQAYVEGAPDATIYHDIAWRTIFGAHRYTPFYLVAERTDRICGVLPLFLVPSLTERSRLVSVPFRDRGGPLFDDRATLEALIGKADQLRTELAADHVELKRISPFADADVANLNLSRSDYWVHSQTPLSGLDETKLLKALGEKTRNMIRQASRAGLRVLERDTDPAALVSWYRVYQESQRALGLPPFPFDFFRQMFAALGTRKLVRLFEVQQADGKAIAACIVFKDRTSGIYAYSASVPAGRNHRPNDLMLFHVISTLLNEGCARFDFGADAPSQSGLLFFKRKWLADQATIPRYYIGPKIPTMIDSSASRFEMIRNITRHLPLPIARGILAPLTRYFG